MPSLSQEWYILTKSLSYTVFKEPFFVLQGRNAEWANDVRGAGNSRSESLSGWVIVASDMPEGVQAALKFICQFDF